jgi:DNA mismatch repair protein MutS2
MLHKLFHDLEYDKIVDYIGNGCQSSAGLELALKLTPLTGVSVINYRLNLLAEIQEGLKHGHDFNFEELLPLDDVFNDTKQVVFDYEEFRLVYLNAALASGICERRAELDGYKELYKLLKKLFPLPHICKQFERIFDADGEVKDSASEELKRIRKKKTLLREQIIRSLQKKFLEPAFEHALQEKFVTQRDGRYVIPVKESYVSQIKGIVQGHSGSKATVFMEPEDVVGVNNDLQMLHQEEKREIFRIFQAFTDDIRAFQTQLESNYTMLSELDCWFSCGRLGKTLQSRVPKIVEVPQLLFKRARHPLMILQKAEVNKVIPFELKLGDDFDFLVLSGPNTGGKTVLLKAVGLLTLMALTGLPIPVEDGTEIGMFDNVVADIGDEQSIEQALSTFSSHISKIKAMLDICNDKTLVLLDEIGAATDPQQGSALAQAILENLLDKQAKGMVTTHYTALKVFAENRDRCTNAAMQFDMKSLIPTYLFQLGFPGDSFAIEVAASLGLHSELIARAKHLTGSQNLEFTEMIKKLAEEKKLLATESWQVKLKSKNLEATIKEYEQRIKKFDDELKSKRKELLKEHQQELIDKQKVLLNELDELKHTDREERKKKTTDMVSKLQDLQSENLDKINDFDPKQRKLVFDPQPGDTVWLADFETNAVIVELKDKDVFVDMNGIHFKTKRSNLMESQKAQIEAVQTQSYAKVKTTASAHFELKLLGLTFDEAQPLIEEFIDAAVVAGLHSLRIVHGKGTGALRTKIQNDLRMKKQVLTFGTPPQEAGGSGVTVITV